MDSPSLVLNSTFMHKKVQTDTFNFFSNASALKSNHFLYPFNKALRRLKDFNPIQAYLSVAL